MRPSFFHHLHPPTIPAPQARWRYTLGAGGMAVFLVLVLLFTGILETYYYIPTPEGAAPSIQTITFLVPYGGLVRNLHYWAAQALVIVCGLHLLRVALTGAYAPPRRFNYLLGIILFVLVLFLDFSGYVLRWDQGIQWALVAGTNLVESIPLIGPALYGLVIGGGRPGAATLVRFYGWHIFGLMLVLLGVGVWHIFRVRRDGGIAAPPPTLRADPRRITRFELVRREALAALLASAALLLVSALFPAPLAAPIQDITLAADARAPWFFLWVQQMLKWGDPFLFGVAIPLGLLTLVALLPYIFPLAQPAELGRWFPRGNRLAQLIVLLVLLVIVALTSLTFIPGL